MALMLTVALNNRIHISIENIPNTKSIRTTTLCPPLANLTQTVTFKLEPGWKSVCVCVSENSYALRTLNCLLKSYIIIVYKICSRFSYPFMLIGWIAGIRFDSLGHLYTHTPYIYYYECANKHTLTPNHTFLSISISVVVYPCLVFASHLFTFEWADDRFGSSNSTHTFSPHNFFFFIHTRKNSFFLQNLVSPKSSVDWCVIKNLEDNEPQSNNNCKEQIHCLLL